MNGERNESGLERQSGLVSGLTSALTRARDGARKTTRTTTRWLIGRLVKVMREAGCGFLKAPSGATVYFSLSDLVGGEAAAAALRPGARLRFQQAGSGIPKATTVAVV